jgi:hypothetical protein
VRTCLFLLLAAALLCPLAGCTKNDAPLPGEPAKPTPPQSPVATREQFDGFSCEVPPGWSRVSPDRQQTKAMLLLGSDRWNTAKAMIKVDVGKPAEPDPRALAEKLAGQLAGSVQPDAVQVDGVPGVRAKMPDKRTFDSPIEAIVVFRGDRAYLIFAGSADGTEVSRALEHVRASWKWGN